MNSIFICVYLKKKKYHEFWDKPKTFITEFYRRNKRIVVHITDNL